MTTETPTPEDDLAAGFSLSANAPAETPATPAEDPPEDPALEQDTPPAETPPADPEASTPADPAPASTPQDPPATPTPDTQSRENDPAYWKQRFSTTEGLLRKEREAREKAEREAREAAARAATPTTPETPAPETDEEWAEFEKQAPAIATAVKRKVERLVQDAIAPIKPHVEKFEQVASKVQTSEVEAHFKAIAEKHADWADVVNSEKFKGWVDTLGWKRQAAETVLERGTADEVVGLISEFKGATAPPPKPHVDVDAQRLRDAAAVRSPNVGPKNGNVPGEPDRNDLNAGFQLSLRTG